MLLSMLWCFCFRGGCGYGSESEGEEPADSRVTLPQDVPGRGNVKAQQSAIRLTEVCIQTLVMLIDWKRGRAIGESLLTSMFTFFLISIHPFWLADRSRGRIYNLSSKLKELINLSNLCNFHLFASKIEGNTSHENCKINGWQKR